MKGARTERVGPAQGEQVEEARSPGRGAGRGQGRGCRTAGRQGLGRPQSLPLLRILQGCCVLPPYFLSPGPRGPLLTPLLRMEVETARVWGVYTERWGGEGIDLPVLGGALPVSGAQGARAPGPGGPRQTRFGCWPRTKSKAERRMVGKQERNFISVRPPPGDRRLGSQRPSPKCSKHVQVHIKKVWDTGRGSEQVGSEGQVTTVLGSGTRLRAAPALQGKSRFPRGTLCPQVCAWVEINREGRIRKHRRRSTGRGLAASLLQESILPSTGKEPIRHASGPVPGSPAGSSRGPAARPPRPRAGSERAAGASSGSPAQPGARRR